MKDFIKIEYETPEIKVILVGKDIITLSEEYTDILGPEVDLE